MKISEATSIAVVVCMQMALRQTNGNVSQAARAVGTSRAAFYKIARRYRVQIRRVEKPDGEIHETSNAR